MAFILSPSVNIIETKLDTSIPQLPTSICGMVGEFLWGPCNQIVNITNDKELVEIFNKPNDTNYESFFSAWNFLQYGNQLIVVRAIDETTAKNAGLEILDATATGTSALSDLILNDEAADDYIPTFAADSKLQIFAKYPGTLGNSVKIAIANATDFETANVITGTSFSSVFDYSPGTDEIAIVVLVDDVITEKYIVSTVLGTKDYEGNNNYISEYINSRSSWIICYSDDSNTDEPDSIEATSLAGGVGATPSSGEVTTAYDLFDDPESIDVNMIIDAGNVSATVQQYIVDNIVEVRKDCVAYFTVKKDAVIGVANISTAIQDCVTYRSTELGRSTEYAALFANWKYQYDQYNDKYRWLPLSGDIAGITARTHYNRDPWIAIAGYNNGKIKNVKKFAINPKRAYRDTLYKNFINPVIYDKTDGPVVLGQKTLIAEPSSFTRLDVRWLFITIEKAIATASKYFMFEKNTAFTRRLFYNMVTPYLRDVQGRDGIDSDDGDGFYVDVSETLNTAEVKSRNEFIANIYIKPAQSAEFIKLNFINVKGSTSFEEIITKTAQ